MSGAKKNRLRRSKITLRRRAAAGESAQEDLFSTVVNDLPEQNPNRDAFGEEGGNDVNENYEDSSEELDSNVCYEDDDEQSRW